MIRLVRAHAFIILTLSSSPALNGQGWTNLGSGEAGTLGVPVLRASTLRVGGPLVISALSARPNSVAWFVIGGKRIDLPILGGTLVPSVECVFPALTDASGKASIGLMVPNDPKLVAVRPIVQSIISDPLATQGAAFSNALEGAMCVWYRSVEDFVSSQNLDPDRSAGSWGNGRVTFSAIGGTGIHGDFDPTLGKDVSKPTGPKVYRWNLDQPGGIRIPASHTTTGKDELVTDGRFFFQTLVIPNNVEVHFIGSRAARISVRGKVEIAGLLSSNGESLELGVFDKNARTGEAGGRGGAMGGAGGNGGDKGDGLGHQVAFDGKAGKDVGLRNGHAYSTNYFGSGGPGSPQFPADGKSSSIIFSYFNVISQQSNRGGGGGGFTSPGGIGYVKWVRNTANQRYAAPGSTPGGKGSPFPAAFPNYTNGFTHQDHYTVGGSGGGGGGSSCGGAIQSLPSSWWVPGRGGAGGGGALALRIGGWLQLQATGRLESRGGSAPFDDGFFSLRGMATPGGGGSGGGLFLQVEGLTQNAGNISVQGGDGGRVFGHFSDQVYNGMNAFGGDGSDGIIHFETAQSPTGYKVGQTVPASPPVQRLDPKEDDAIVAVRSKWYPTALSLAPTFLRYEVEASVDGKAVLYSDDPKVGALAGGSPVGFLVQGAQLTRDANGKLVPLPNTSPTVWTKFVGPHGASPLFGTGSTGYRFELRLDRSPGKVVAIRKVTVYWCL